MKEEASYIVGVEKFGGGGKDKWDLKTLQRNGLRSKRRAEIKKDRGRSVREVGGRGREGCQRSREAWVPDNIYERKKKKNQG